MKERKKMLSGIKPTGLLHIGNYFGMMKQSVELQSEYESTFFIPDYHALTTLHDPKLLKSFVREVILGYLSVGLDPKKVLLFRQSDVPEHTELAWIFNCITTVSYLSRGHAYKDAEAKGEEVSVGTFDYPMLMAADILLYDTDVVPVGQDQKQHVEFARDTAEKFNRLFGETFKLPEERIMKEVATVPGLDGRKMSKSYNNYIPLFASREVIVEKVMAIVTDSKGGRPENVFAIHRLLRDAQVLEPLYDAHVGNYKALKEALVEDLDAFIAPMREKREKLEKEYDVDALLREGGERARAIASTKMRDVRAKVGVR
ncbi:MAG: tryptophan--tRNA ligase [Parcubacteria group bacterium]|nr:tryptophan--tRNA ligase [Parcubacteria group bacterium]